MYTDTHFPSLGYMWYNGQDDIKNKISGEVYQTGRGGSESEQPWIVWESSYIFLLCTVAPNWGTTINIINK